MTLSRLFAHQRIGDNDIYIVDAHHCALAAWAIQRRRLERAPNLITIDHHTDTLEAFLRHAHLSAMDGHGDEREIIPRLIAEINSRDDGSLLSAIQLLQHDEHIHAATMSGILGYAFSIQLSDRDGYQSLEQQAYDQDRQARWPSPPTVPQPARPMTYQEPEDHIFVIPYDCAIGCTKVPYDDDCFAKQSATIIESTYLDDQLTRGAEIAKCIGLHQIDEQPYILDIDLDVFHCRKAIEPDDPTTFYRLIRNATIITIAREPECVDELKLEGETIDANLLLDRLIDHINAAIS
ncbi:MAG TPA: UPF0489 family protein [Burkholderiaceae bacterium]|nr:UPF0489 family protein [Burkholderiaceae bacterium]